MSFNSISRVGVDDRSFGLRALKAPLGGTKSFSECRLEEFIRSSLSLSRSLKEPLVADFLLLVDGGEGGNSGTM